MSFTEHFNEREYFVSNDYPELAKAMHERARPECKAALYLLSELVMEPIRTHFDIPIIITSGFRSQALNNALRRKYGTANNSLHKRAIACDFTTRHDQRYLLPRMFEYIKDNLSDLISQAILYQYSDVGFRNIHIALKAEDREQYITTKTVERGV